MLIAFRAILYASLYNIMHITGTKTFEK